MSAAGLCRDCAAGDHSHHQRAWAGICIGCTCTWKPPAPVSDSPTRDTAKMSVDLTTQGLHVVFTMSGGDVVRLRLNSYQEALTLARNILHAITKRWPDESSRPGSSNRGGQ